MKFLTLIPLLFFSLSMKSQITGMTPKIYTCFELEGKDTIIVPCEEHPHIISNTRNLDPNKTNIDSLCHQMSLNFHNHLNKVRRDLNLSTLSYDSSMFILLTYPHNLWQVKNAKVSHSEGNLTLSERFEYYGYNGIGECVAYNFRFDETQESMFLTQYRDSPSHWKILTDPKYNYISISTLYDQDKRRFYSTVNVRK